VSRIRHSPAEPVRVLHLIGTLAAGGTEGQVAMLASRMANDGFVTKVVCLEAGGPHRARLEADGVPVAIVGYEGFRIFRHPLRTTGHLLRLVREVRKFKPDVLHAHLFWAYVLAPFAARLAGVPHVVASRRGLGVFRRSIPPSWLALERKATELTELIVANSEAVRRDVLSSEGVPPGKVIVIHNGIDLGRFGAARPARQDLGLAERAPVAITVANLIVYKGHTHLLRAWEAVTLTVPNAILLLVGEGPARGDLEREVAARNLGRNVRFLGSRTDIPPLLASADLLVHPALEEGFCNAILEGMAAGKAVVATDVGGNREAVVDGETGLLVPAGDSGSLAQAVVGLLREEERREALGQAGRMRAERLFGTDAMARRYEELYRGLAASSSLP